MKTLIVGCSFVNNLKSFGEINHDKFDIFGSPGAGNQAIAARVQHQLSCESYRMVVILWSGVNRIDLALPLITSELFPFRYVDQIGSVVWYHSGGFGCSGQSKESPKFVRSFLDKVYSCADDRYLSQLTVNALLATQSLLQTKQVAYKMSFVYDQTSSEINCNEVSHGKLNSSVQGYDQIAWSKFAEISPHAWAQKHEQLDHIGYYPKKQAFLQWFKDQLEIDLTV